MYRSPAMRAFLLREVINPPAQATGGQREGCGDLVEAVGVESVRTRLDSVSYPQTLTHYNRSNRSKFPVKCVLSTQDQRGALLRGVGRHLHRHVLKKMQLADCSSSSGVVQASEVR